MSNQVNIDVVPYNEEWPKMFKIREKELKEALKDNVIKIIHFGSTSVVGLAAKPKIDIMCIVKDLKKAATQVESIGYTGRGELNIPLRLFYSITKPFVTHVHLLLEDNGDIGWSLKIAEFLRENEKAREMYQNFKLELVKQNQNGFQLHAGSVNEYTVKKGVIIHEIAKMAGIDAIRFVIASNENELEEFKDIPTPENSHNLCLYKGLDIVCIAQVTFDEKSKTGKINFITPKVKDDGTYENMMKENIKKWLQFHDITI